MSIRSKISLALLAMLSMLAVATIVIEQTVVRSSFETLETQSAERDLVRVSEAIEHDIEHLSLICRDWAVWDDTYQYMLDQNRAFERANLAWSTFEMANLNLLGFVDCGGRFVWCQAYDWREKRQMEVPKFCGDFFHRHGLDILAPVTAAAPDCIAGLIGTERGPMMVCAHAILNTDAEGPARGLLIMGRLLDDAAVAELAEQTRIELTASELGGRPLDAGQREILGRLVTSGRTFFISQQDRHINLGHLLLTDMNGAPVMLVRARLPRLITLYGSVATRIATSLNLAAGAMVLAVLWVALRRLVIVPLTTITAHAAHLARTDDLHARLEIDRADEIGVLVDTFNRMVDRLRQSRDRQLELAHRVGMADGANLIVHNAGNTVDSLNAPL